MEDNKNKLIKNEDKDTEKFSKIAEEILKAGNKVANEINNNSRYLSWRHCYNVFNDSCLIRNFKNIDDYYDYLALNLAFYLASWGMYRGSSFLLDYDYKIHIPVVKKLLGAKKMTSNNTKININKKDYDKIDNDKYKDIFKGISNGYKNIINKDNRNATETLVTKILLGTYGCIPAFDRYLKSALRFFGCKSLIVNETSLEWLNYLWERVEELISGYKEINKLYEKENYPPMKILDMCLWGFGKELEDSIIIYGNKDERKKLIEYFESKHNDIKIYQKEDEDYEKTQDCLAQIRCKRDKYNIKYKKNQKLIKIESKKGNIDKIINERINYKNKIRNNNYLIK